jgi:membrane protease YdiL (CAAX protease family)
MKDILIFKIWQHKFPALAALFTIAFVFLWPSIPLGGITKWLEFFYYYTPQNYLYLLMAIFSGLYVGIYVYDKTVARCCSIQNRKVGILGSSVGILLGACPACIPVLAFFLPLSATIVLSRISLAFLVIAIGIMAFSIYRMNGFRKV